MTPQEKIEDLERRVEQLEKALAMVCVQSNRDYAKPLETRKIADAFKSGEHFRLVVTPVPNATRPRQLITDGLNLTVGPDGPGLVKT